MGVGGLSFWIKRPETEADNSPPPSTTVKNQWSHISTSVCLHAVHTDNIYWRLGCNDVWQLTPYVSEKGACPFAGCKRAPDDGSSTLLRNTLNHTASNPRWRDNFKSADSQLKVSQCLSCTFEHCSLRYCALNKDHDTLSFVWNYNFRASPLERVFGVRPSGMSSSCQTGTRNSSNYPVLWQWLIRYFTIKVGSIHVWRTVDPHVRFNNFWSVLVNDAIVYWDYVAPVIDGVMNKRRWWNEYDKGKRMNSEQTLSKWHYAHNKSHMGWPEIEPR